MFEPENDGIDHINIYSKGKTKLGQLLSNFAETPFEYPPFGKFNSVEGFWYWYFSGMKHDELKVLSGFAAKQTGRSYITDHHEITDTDKEIVLEAIRCKLRQNKYILDMLVDNNLPLVHYYCYVDSNGGYKIIDKPEFNWIIDEYNRISELMIKQKVKDHINMFRTKK